MKMMPTTRMAANRLQAEMPMMRFVFVFIIFNNLPSNQWERRIAVVKSNRAMPRLSLLSLRLCRLRRLSVSVLLGIIVFGHRVRVIPWVAQSFFGYGIVAADAKRLATKDPIHGKNHPYEKSPLGKRLQCVFRTGRGKAAGREPLKRRQNLLIKADQPNA